MATITPTYDNHLLTREMRTTSSMPVAAMTRRMPAVATTP